MSRVLAAEALGTALLLAIVVGSGVMADALAAGNVAVALLANSIATGTGLVVLVLALGPISGAHLNPVVSGLARVRGTIGTSELLGRVAAQLVGAVLGCCSRTPCSTTRRSRSPRTRAPASARRSVRRWPRSGWCSS
ncbi:MAG: aquaporin [Sandaracinus sp.]